MKQIKKNDALRVTVVVVIVVCVVEGFIKKASSSAVITMATMRAVIADATIQAREHLEEIWVIERLCSQTSHENDSLLLSTSLEVAMMIFCGPCSIGASTRRLFVCGKRISRSK